MIVDETAYEGLMDRLTAELTHQPSRFVSRERPRLTLSNLSTPFGGGSVALEHVPTPEPSW